MSENVVIRRDICTQISNDFVIRAFVAIYFHRNVAFKELFIIRCFYGQPYILITI